jgi:hypothetical protein
MVNFVFDVVMTAVAITAVVVFIGYGLAWLFGWED